MSEENKVAANEQASASQPEVVWNDANMKSVYVNATNVVAGREEVMMLLGVNRSWKMNQGKVDVDIAERVVMTPFTAKRLAIMLGATLKAYEATYGKIDIGLPEAKNGSSIHLKQVLGLWSQDLLRLFYLSFCWMYMDEVGCVCLFCSMLPERSTE